MADIGDKARGLWTWQLQESGKRLPTFARYGFEFSGASLAVFQEKSREMTPTYCSRQEDCQGMGTVAAWRQHKCHTRAHSL